MKPLTAASVRRRIVDVAQRLRAEELVVGTSGNVSAREPGTNQCWITPSGVDYDRLEPDDLVLVDLDGHVRHGSLKPSSDTAVHLAIYRSRPEVDGRHRLYASWMDSNQLNSPIWVAFSDDFATSWKGPFLATRIDHGGSGGDKDILVVDGPRVWVTWEHLTQNTVAFTPDVETQPFTPVNIPNPAGTVALASGGARDTHGNLYFVWDAVFEQGIAKGPTTLFIGRSDNDGAAWQTFIIDVSAVEPAVPGASYDFFGASVALAIIPRPGLATDRLVAVYNKGLAPGAPERIYTKYSDNRGETWLTGQLQQLSAAPDGAMHGFPAAIADEGGVRVTWMDNRVNPTCTSASTPGACGTWHVWSRTSPDGVSGWTPEVRLDQRSGFGFPYGDYQSLALDSSGNTYAVWGEGPDETGPGNIFFTRS